MESIVAAVDDASLALVALTAAASSDRRERDEAERADGDCDESERAARREETRAAARSASPLPPARTVDVTLFVPQLRSSNRAILYEKKSANLLKVNG